MESRRPLDFARSAAERAASRAIVILVLIALCRLPGGAQAVPSLPEAAEQVRQLFEQQRWAEVVREVESRSVRDAEIDFYYGSALAQLGRWADARAAFLAGRRLRPSDKRFPIELGGVAFKEKDYAGAIRWLRRGLRIDPHDSYANDFLATAYFLQGNLEAALKYWNRVGKPQIENVRTPPELKIDPALLDRAFAFAPASTLRLDQLTASQARVGGLGVFPVYSFSLAARADGKFDLDFRARERNGWGANRWEALASTFRGLFYQTIYPAYYNVHGSAANLESLVRWDAQKRRLWAAFSSPFERNPKYRYQLSVDLRNENWDVFPSFTGPAPLLGALNLRKESVAGEVTSFASGRWGWSMGAEFSDRQYRNIFPGTALAPEILLNGPQLKHLAELNYMLWRTPEERFSLKTSISSGAARIWSDSPKLFEKLQGSAEAQWFPQSKGDDYAMAAQLRAGKTFGQVPFDELFMLGLERDNDLWMRAHIGTRDGRKGSAPLGRQYFLSNWEMDKNLYNNGFFGVKLGPVLDVGRITDPSPGLGSNKWLWDTGAQAKFSVLGVGVTFVYGKDLRSGNNAFYFTTRR
jgi:tetratricopeptide (TPR) repeat protein